MRARRLHVFLPLAAVFTLAIGLWSPATDWHTALVRAGGNLLLHPAGARRSVRFESQTGWADTRVSGFAGETSVWTLEYDHQQQIRWSLAALCGMILATPLRPIGRVAALFGGIALFTFFSLFQSGVHALAIFAAADPASGPSWMRVANVATEAFRSVIPEFCAAFVIWTLVASPARTLDLAPTIAWITRSRARRADEAPEAGRYSRDG